MKSIKIKGQPIGPGGFRTEIRQPLMFFNIDQNFGHFGIVKQSISVSPPPESSDEQAREIEEKVASSVAPVLTDEQAREIEEPNEGKLNAGEGIGASAPRPARKQQLVAPMPFDPIANLLINDLAEQGNHIKLTTNARALQDAVNFHHEGDQEQSDELRKYNMSDLGFTGEGPKASVPTYMVVSGPIEEYQKDYIKATLKALSKTHDSVTILNCNSNTRETKGISDDLASSLSQESGVAITYASVPIDLDVEKKLEIKLPDGNNFKKTEEKLGRRTERSQDLTAFGEAQEPNEGKLNVGEGIGASAPTPARKQQFGKGVGGI